MRVLFKDLALPQHIPFSRTRTIFSFRNGIFTPIERIKEKYKGQDLELYFSHPDKEYQNLVASVDNLLSVPNSMSDADFDVVILSSQTDTITALSLVDENIISDLDLMDKSNFLSVEELNNKFPDIEIIGDASKLYISRDVNILSRNTVFDTTEGYIIINSGTNIAPFTYLKGTLYVGKDSDITNARISHNTIIGDHCRISGEVSNSIFNDYSYKSHDGFIGCSVIGKWVNFGAMSTTSNLKNNYSNISLLLPQNRSLNCDKVLISTNTMKFGSLIGDYVKTAIGTLINCGSVIDMGSNILVKPEKYIMPLRWIDDTKEYDKVRFVRDTKFIVGRKGVKQNDNFEELVNLIK